MGELINYLLLAVIVVFITGQSVLKKVYNGRCETGVFLFSSMTSLCAMLVFVVSNRTWSFRPEMFIPASAFAIAYASSSLFTMLAIKYGSLAITSLITSYSLLLPGFYGIFFLKEEVTWKLIVGIVLLAISLFLTNYKKSDKSPEDSTNKRLSWLWVFVTIAFVGNGMCSTVQKAAAVSGFNEGEMKVVMILALAMVSVILFIFSALSAERKEWKRCFKAASPIAIVSGLMNGAVNLLVIVLNPRMNASVMFPIISGGGLVLIFLYSMIVYKEKFRPAQWVGFGVGLVSIVLLNI